MATLNVWGLPDPLGYRVPERMRAIAVRAAELDLDVICFQEVWTAEAREILVRGGRRAGLVHIWHNEATLQGSGLLLLSRYPIEAARFEQFALPGLPSRFDHPDYYGRKGFVRVRLRTPAGPLVVANTHLQARYPGDVPHEYRAVRVGQIVQLVMGISSLRQPLVTLGDFNFQTSDPEARVWAGLSGSRDAALVAGRPQATAVRANPFRGGSKPDRRVDYVFLRNGGEHGLGIRHVQRAFDEVFELGGRPGSYSDHAGVLAELELAPGTGGIPPQVDPGAARLATQLLAEGRRLAERRRRNDRALAGAGLGAAVLASVGLRDQRVTRRRILRGALQGAAVLALAPSVGFSIVSEYFAPDELRAFERLGAHLESLSDLDADLLA